MITEVLLTILMGIGLSAASGFRIFIPFLIISIASLSGNLTLASSFSWIGTIPALITFSIATILEIGGYYIPWIDNLLDTIASPAAVIAGIILMASVISGMSPLFKWTLAIVAGGGVAGIIQTLTGISRVASTTTTGGLGNHLISSAEMGGSITISLFAILFPVVAAFIVLVLIIWAIKTIIKRFRPKTS